MANTSAWRTPEERKRFVIAALVSGVAWLLMAVSIVGLLYAALGAVGFLIAHAVFIATIKGNGVRLSDQQLPDLYAKVKEAAKKLELGSVPDVYLINQRSVFNAFATRFLGRSFVVLYSELLEHAESMPGAVDFIIGHELGHLALGHLRWRWFLLPAMITPWLGAAYSRACEYSCDRVGLGFVGDEGAAIGGLTLLAAGGKYAGRLDVSEYLLQVRETGGFWMAVLELGMSHPYLPKRVAAIRRRSQPDTVVSVSRNPFAYLFAPVFGFASSGGSLIVVVAIIGILAAIAIPNFQRFQEKARAAAAEKHLHEVMPNDSPPR